MKNLCKNPAILFAAAVLMAGLCSASSVPTEWTVRIGPRSAAYQAERRHGDALALKASLVYNGQPLAYSGPARLYAQTNGMGAAWWDLAPCTVNSNILEATWLPSFDTGADVVDLFLGGPSNYQAAARIRFLPSPGAAPNALPLPVPVLDFSTVVVSNAPFATFADVADATNDVLAAVADFARTNSVLAGGPYLSLATGGTIRAANAKVEVVKPGVPVLGLAPMSTLISPGEIVITSGPNQWQLTVTETGFATTQDGETLTFDLPYSRGSGGTLALVSDVENGGTNKLDGVNAYAAWSENAPYMAVGTIVFYQGRLWRNTAPTSHHGLPPGAAGSVWTSAGVTINALKQDTLPYPTNAIPYAAIADAPTPPSVFYDSAGGAASVSANVLTYQAASNSVGSVTLLAGTNVLHLAVPTPITGRIRDFGLTVTTEDAATITLDSSVSWRFDAASTNLAAGSWNRIYCTESPANVFTLQLWTPDSSQEAAP